MTVYIRYILVIFSAHMYIILDLAFAIELETYYLEFIF